uniref:Uncharacterized protein n=1 Tax=Arundo donax TaxID=35708 RepID=A0A0A9DQK7_ARUDO
MPPASKPSPPGGATSGVLPLSTSMAATSHLMSRLSPPQSPASSPPTWAPAAASASRRSTSTTNRPPWTPGSSPPLLTTSRNLTSGMTDFIGNAGCFRRHHHRRLLSASRLPSASLPSADATSWMPRLKGFISLRSGISHLKMSASRRTHCTP